MILTIKKIGINSVELSTPEGEPVYAGYKKRAILFYLLKMKEEGEVVDFPIGEYMGKKYIGTHDAFEFKRISVNEELILEKVLELIRKSSKHMDLPENICKGRALPRPNGSLEEARVTALNYFIRKQHLYSIIDKYPQVDMNDITFEIGNISQKRSDLVGIIDFIRDQKIKENNENINLPASGIEARQSYGSNEELKKTKLEASEYPKMIPELKAIFKTMESKEDLVHLLSEAKNLLYGERCNPVQLKSLTYFANPEICKDRYQTFIIKKKSGADRIINAPVQGLKSILQPLNYLLQHLYEPHIAATGFVRNKSIVDNAQKHIGHHYVLNLDLKDFFHSFDRNRVKLGFMSDPFNLNGDREPLAFLLASLCTHPFEINGKIRTVLPQGSPTSPTLTNILCLKLDRRLNGFANRFGATYSRYADDITFSSPHNIYNDEEFDKELKRIIEEDQRLIINPVKTRLQKTGFRQEVTGLIVNEKVNVRRRYIKQIRMYLYYWERYGYERANYIFIMDYKGDKGHVKKGQPNLVNVLNGKLEFLKMIKGEGDGLYLRLKKRFNSLIGELESFKVKSDLSQLKFLPIPENSLIGQNINITDIVNRIFSEGLDKAMKQYSVRQKRNL